MKKFRGLLAIILLLAVVITTLASCTPKEETPTHVDYATEAKLDMNSAETVKVTVEKVNLFIDGDTTHFKLPSGAISHDAVLNNVLKARYLAINTPESTGKIEKWGNEAAQFTRNKLESATSIVLESNDANWNVDSTGKRITVWVWYLAEGSDTYRNLNIEILQEGYAIGSNAANNRYGKYCTAAIAQAKAENLYVHNKTLVDPDFPTGGPQAIPLRDIRLNIEDHYYHSVYFEGVVVMNDGGTIYVESYDEDTELYYGITAYYGTGGLTGVGKEMLAIGNKLKVVGIITYFEGGDIWQVSDLYYDEWKPDDPRNLELVDAGTKYEAAYTPTSAAIFLADKTITVDGVEITKKYYELVQNTSISMENLTVTDVWTTTNDGDSKGAVTITCRAETGETITVRTNPLLDQNGNLVLESAYVGQTIDVKGMVEMYQGEPQIKVFSYSDITIH